MNWVRPISFGYSKVRCAKRSIRRGAEKMDTTNELPPALPVRPEDCRSLKEWIELGLGMPQHEIAHLARTSQGRISLIVNGQMPRRAHWPALLKAMRLEGKETLFYRWVMAARLERLRLAALPKSINETEPLFAAAVTVPRTVLTLDESNDEIERRAQA